MPDIFIPMITDSIHSFYNLLANKGLIFQFAFDYTDANRAKLAKYDNAKAFEEGFEMSNREYADLVAYAEDKGIEATSEEIRVSKDKIKILFKAFVGRNILDEKGFYPIYHQIDTTFKRAVYELSIN